MTLAAQLEELLRASQVLSTTADTYASAIGEVSGASTPADVFETGEVSGAWESMVTTLWDYLAQSQDNLNDSSLVMVHYVNALCAQDSGLASDLLAEVKDYNDALGDTGDDPNDELPDPLPEPDLNDPGSVIPTPDSEPAEYPGD